MGGGTVLAGGDFDTVRIVGVNINRYLGCPRPHSQMAGLLYSSTVLGY